MAMSATQHEPVAASIPRPYGSIPVRLTAVSPDAAQAPVPRQRRPALRDPDRARDGIGREVGHVEEALPHARGRIGTSEHDVVEVAQIAVARRNPRGVRRLVQRDRPDPIPQVPRLRDRVERDSVAVDEPLIRSDPKCRALLRPLDDPRRPEAHDRRAGHGEVGVGADRHDARLGRNRDPARAALGGRRQIGRPGHGHLDPDVRAAESPSDDGAVVVEAQPEPSPLLVELQILVRRLIRKLVEDVARVRGQPDEARKIGDDRGDAPRSRCGRIGRAERAVARGEARDQAVDVRRLVLRGQVFRGRHVFGEVGPGERGGRSARTPPLDSVSDHALVREPDPAKLDDAVPRQGIEAGQEPPRLAILWIERIVPIAGRASHQKCRNGQRERRAGDRPWGHRSEPTTRRKSPAVIATCPAPSAAEARRS